VREDCLEGFVEYLYYMQHKDTPRVVNISSNLYIKSRTTAVNFSLETFN